MHIAITEEKESPLAKADWKLKYLCKSGVQIDGGSAHVPSSKSLAGTSIGLANIAVDGAMRAASELSINDAAFMDLVLAPIWEMDNSAVYAYLNLLRENETMTEFDGAPVSQDFKHQAVQIAALSVACAYVVKSLKSEANSSAAWESACQANYWVGLIQGTLSGKAMGVEVGRSALGKAGASARHAENRKLKQDVFDWCDKNMQNFKSMDKAAETIHGKVVPVSFRTARDWVGDWKKIRSAGKP